MNQTTAHVPFLTETELTNRSAIYQKVIYVLFKQNHI